MLRVRSSATWSVMDTFEFSPNSQNSRRSGKHACPVGEPLSNSSRVATAAVRHGYAHMLPMILFLFLCVIGMTCLHLGVLVLPATVTLTTLFSTGVVQIAFGRSGFASSGYPAAAKWSGAAVGTIIALTSKSRQKYQKAPSWPSSFPMTFVPTSSVEQMYEPAGLKIIGTHFNVPI